MPTLIQWVKGSRNRGVNNSGIFADFFTQKIEFLELFLKHDFPFFGIFKPGFVAQKGHFIEFLRGQYRVNPPLMA